MEDDKLSLVQKVDATFGAPTCVLFVCILVTRFLCESCAFSGINGHHKYFFSNRKCLPYKDRHMFDYQYLLFEETWGEKRKLFSKRYIK